MMESGSSPSTADAAPDAPSTARKRNVPPNVYGNFDSYYGYRNADHDVDDPRIALLPPDFFAGKYVLDVGCNVGLPTITIAKKLRPKLIVGVDIDEQLVRRARKNISLHYSLMRPKRVTERSTASDDGDDEDEWNYFPVSFPITIGTIPWVHPPGKRFALDTATPFPGNVAFWALDYVHDDHADVFAGGFDVVLAWSITKWIHLNWGDDGIRAFFQRAHADLKPGGCLVLEPQEFSTYSKRKRMSPEFAKTYQTIQLRPEHFGEYLTGTLGFSGPVQVGIAPSHAKGFQRPLLMFTK